MLFMLLFCFDRDGYFDDLLKNVSHYAVFFIQFLMICLHFLCKT